MDKSDSDSPLQKEEVQKDLLQKGDGGDQVGGKVDEVEEVKSASSSDAASDAASDETTSETATSEPLSKKEQNRRKRAAREVVSHSGSARQNVRKFDSAGFRLRQQVLSSARVSLQDVLGETPDVAALDAAHRVVTIEDDIAVGARYVYEGDGLRRVPPYYFTYLTFCKQRWRDRNILEIFSSEFREKEPAYYRQLIEDGKVTINSERVGVDAIVRNGDLISHRTHKHEPPVPDTQIDIVYQDQEIVVIDKPAGIPVHPVGRFRFNTITEIMKHELKIPVHPAHRLDRLTSGVMIFARTGKAANQLSANMRNRTIYKEYVARVLGEFPANDGNDVVCDLPVLTVDPRLGLNMVKDEGKPATTVFRRLSYNGKTSLVSCKPLTGRTHQIRLHLQYLGHPIANDPIYANRAVFGFHLGKGGEIDEADVRTKLARMGKKEEARSAAFEEIAEQHNRARGEKLTGELCEVCQSPLYFDPSVQELEIWLHALRYWSTEDGWEYKTKMPAWAAEDFQ